MKMVRYVLRKLAVLSRTREILFFVKRGPELAPTNVVELDRTDLAILQEDGALPWASELGEVEWFAQGGRLYAVMVSGQPVSFGWAKIDDHFHIGEICCRVEVRERLLWIWACFTPAQYRGQNHYPCLLRGIRGLNDAPLSIIYCLNQNGASRRGIGKAGFEEAFTVLWHRFGVFLRRDRFKFVCGLNRD